MRRMTIKLPSNRELDAQIRRPPVRPAQPHRNRYREAQQGYRKHRGGGEWSPAQQG